MNFKRIEWIFLVAFIVLDFFLMTTYYQYSGLDSIFDEEFEK